MAYPNAPLPPLVPTKAGTWSVWSAVGSFLVVFVLHAIWTFFILIPQWKLVGGEPDPAYIAHYNLGTALFSGAGLVLAIAAVAFGVRSILVATSFSPGEAGRRTAIVRGWIGICLGILFAVYSVMLASYIW